MGKKKTNSKQRQEYHEKDPERDSLGCKHKEKTEGTSNRKLAERPVRAED